jgi:hypothetical protein
MALDACRIPASGTRETLFPHAERNRRPMPPVARATGQRLVCARHGHDANGVQVPCRKTRHENEETTTRGQARKGHRPREGRLWENCEPMDKNRMEGRHGTTSWHNTAKSSGLPVEVNAVVVQGSIVPLPGEIWRERTGQKSAEAMVVGETSRSAKSHGKVAGGLTQRRAEPHGNVLTAWRTANPSTTPDGEVEPGVGAMGSMWAFRSRLRPIPCA